MLGRRAVFEACFELREAFELLLRQGRPDKLALVTGEMWPSERRLAEEGDEAAVEGETLMEGVEHLGQYVFEMTRTRVEMLREERGLPPAASAAGGGADGSAVGVEEVAGEVGGLGVGEGGEDGEEEDEREGPARGEGFEVEEDD